MFRIIQISDLHIPSHDLGKYDIKIKKQFSLLIDTIKNETFDLLVITGDLAYSHASEGIYSYIHSKLKVLKQPFLIVPGNHDSPLLLRKFFAIQSEHDEQIYFSYKSEFEDLLFLDSSAGSISSTQLDWLRKKLENTTDKAIIFIHHPVIDSGVRYMDAKHALANKEEIENILLSYNKPAHVFCGHFHSDTTVVKKNLIQYLCPSNYYQIDPSVEFLQKENASTGYRIIELNKDYITSRVRHFYI